MLVSAVLLVLAIAPTWRSRESPAEAGVTGFSVVSEAEDVSPSSSSPGMLPTDDPAGNQPETPRLEVLAESPASVQETNRPRFDWSQVESEDYRTYLANLRDLGVPEQTVRDIIRADVKEAFATRRAEAVAERFRDFQYWKTGPDEVAARAELERNRREVDESMKEALGELLGPDTQTPSTAADWRKAALDWQLAALPPGTREATAALLLQYADVDRQVKELAENRLPLENPDERLRIMDDYERKRESLQALLTQEEYEMVDMTVSWTADNLRRAMKRFQPTEHEFRIIFREWRAQDEDLAARFARGDPDPGNAHVFNNLSRYLGPERYAQYRESWWK